ncbi:hypothetical protein ONZ45_g8736 [Pleurotus djamor]|nr:hypothetical protein ONZ45_g8736 [Pleurotus djamor]
MPPNQNSVAIKPPPSKPNEKSVIKVGPKHLSSKSKGIRDENGQRPTTQRALVLRKSKHAFGTGEVVLLGKMTGREKLDLLAEDLADLAGKAVAAPFSLEKCLKIAEAQSNAYLDDIRSLHDADLFCSIMQVELASRLPPAKGSKLPPMNNPTKVATLVGARQATFQDHDSFTS